MSQNTSISFGKSPANVTSINFFVCCTCIKEQQIIVTTKFRDHFGETLEQFLVKLWNNNLK